MLMLCLIAGCNLAITAQQYYFRPLPAFHDRDIRQITVLFQSADRWMWVGTDRGLFLTDGMRYDFVQRMDGQRRRVTSIGEDLVGRLWAGYEDGYIQVLDLYTHSEDLNIDTLKSPVTYIRFSADGKALITTYGQGVWHWGENKINRVICEDLAEITDVYTGLLTGEDRIFIATDNGIWTWQKDKCHSINHLSHDRGLADEIVTHLAPASGGLWVGMYDNVITWYDMESDTIWPGWILPVGVGHLTSMSSGSRNEVWMTTENALLSLSLERGIQAHPFPNDGGQEADQVYVDRDGNLWLVSGRNLYYALTGLSFYTPEVSGIQTVAVTGDRIWIGSDNGLYSLHIDTRKLERWLKGEQINVLSLWSDTAGHLWVGTFGQGLYILNPSGGRYRHLTERNGISNNSILNLDGRDNQIWLATLGGITEIDWSGSPISSELTITDFHKAYQFPSGYVYDVYVEPNGLVWFGTDGMGVFVLNKDELKQIAVRDEQVPIEENVFRTIYSIAGGNDSAVWLSAAGGYVIRTDTSGIIHDHVVASSGSVQSIIKSGPGKLLLVSDGIIEVRNVAGDLFQFDDHAGLTGFYPHLNAVTGGSDRAIWIAGADRLLKITDAAANNASNVELHLRALSHNRIFPPGAIRLPGPGHVIDFRFQGIWYPDPEMLQYRYRLTGHDAEWIYTRESRAVYSRLTPGNYTFEVEAALHPDFAGAVHQHVSVYVPPPVFLRWWFVLGTILFVGGMVYGYIRKRIKRLNRWHELEKEKALLQLHAIQAQVNPHFLFNSFNTLTSLIEEDQQIAVEYLDRISGFFRGVLMHRDATLIRLDDELVIVRNYISILQKRYGNGLRIVEEIQHTGGWIAPLSIQLLVENAIKHNTVSEGKPLTIHIRIDARWVEVSNNIQPRLDEAPESLGFGLSSLLARYQYLTHEKMEIVREPHTFTVRVPVIEKGKQV